MGEYWFTTLSAVRRGEADWETIAAYEAPIRRFLEERFRTVPVADRDDVAQEILVAMHERLVAGYDAAKGPFRPFLRTAIANKVRDLLRRRKSGTGSGSGSETGEEVSDDDADSIDLEAEVVRAVRACHDRRASGPARDRSAVYVISGALVDGLSNQEIAAREGLSVDQVKRVLQEARREILEAILAATPEPARAAELARACLREPRREARLLEDEPDARVREAVARLLAGLRRAGGRNSGGGEDFVRGITAVFAA